MAAISQSRSNPTASGLFQSLSFRTSITILVVLVIAPIFALFLYTNFQDRQAQTQLVESEAIQVAGFAADTQQKVIEEGRQLLVQLAANPLVRDVNNPDQSTCSKFMADQNAQYAQYNAIGAINLKGDIVCASVQSSTPVSAAKQRYFQDTVKTQAFTVGDYGIGNLTHKARINFAYPLFDDAKQLQGVVYLAVDLAWLNNLVSNVNLPPNSTFTVIDNKGIVLAHYPDADKYTGKPADAPIYKTILSTKQDGSGESIGLDGVQKLYGYKPLGLDPKNPSAFVAVGVPSSEAFATVNQNFMRNLIGLGIILVVTLILGWVGTNTLIVRRTNLLLEATKKLSAGDLHARTGLPHNRSEFGQLAHGFDEMAGQLENQTHELKQARDTLEEHVQELEQARVVREKLIADLQAAKRLADENSRIKSEFLSTMSHELRTPLNAIEGFTGIILNRIGGTDYNNNTEGYLSRIRSNSKRLLQLINDFLDLSRVEAGRLELANQPFSPERLAKRWQEEIGVLAEKKGIQFALSLDTSLPETLYGDEEAISKVALNLLGNAIKFTEAGQVALALERVDGTWGIVVEDTGIGIPPHAREFIFEEFRQVDQSSKRKYGGTGLGLAIVQKYTRAMGGTVQVKSEFGKGSTFTVSLPLKTTA